jgi:hypothetical protein
VIECERCGNQREETGDCATCAAYLKLGILPEEARRCGMELYETDDMIQAAAEQLMELSTAAAALETQSDDPVERTRLLAELLQSIATVTAENATLLSRQYYFLRSQRARLN